MNPSDPDEDLGLIASLGGESPKQTDPGGDSAAIPSKTKIILLVGHVVSVFVMGGPAIALIATSDTVTEFEYNIKITDVDKVDGVLVSKNRIINHGNPLDVVAVVLFITAVAHLVQLLLWTFYVKWLANKHSPIRWMEYSLSAGLIMVTVAVLAMVQNIWNLLGIFFGTFTAVVFFYMAEEPQPLDWKKNWTPKVAAQMTWKWIDPPKVGKTLMAAGLFLGAWLPILYNFGDAAADTAVGSDMPAFVYVLINFMPGLFLLFPLILGLINSGVVAYATGEVMFMGFSLVTKTMLWIIVLSGLSSDPPPVF